MAKPHFYVQPQHLADGAWQGCAGYRAQRWAVLDQEGRVHATHRSKRTAEADRISLQRNAEGPPRHYTLGKRMPSYRTDKEA